MQAQILSCELFGKKHPLRLRYNDEKIDLESKIGEIVEKNKEGISQNMFEFVYDRPSSDDEISQEEAKKIEAILEEYSCKYPVLEKFDGASELVKACQKAIQNWTRKDLREVWDQWLKEVESFISFPGFFSKLTSEKKNSTLFFDILSGVPENETKEALKKREKMIEKKTQFQYNYKAPEFENPWLDRQLEMVKQTYNVVQKIFDTEKNSDELREK